MPLPYFKYGDKTMNNCYCGSGGATEWGTIIGDLANQTDLINYIYSKVKDKQNKYLNQKSILIWDNVTWYSFTSGLDADTYYNGTYKTDSTTTVNAYEISRVQASNGTGSILFFVLGGNDAWLCRCNITLSGSTYTSTWTRTSMSGIFEVKSNKTNSITTSANSTTYPTTNAVRYSTLQQYLAIQNGGRNLGTSFTDTQKKEIKNGTFNGLNIGDYWAINGFKWRIWHTDYFYGRGDTLCSTHHLIVMPDANLLKADGSTTHYMQDSDITTNGYVNTKYWKTYKSQCLSTVKSAFGDYVLTHRELCCDSTDTSSPSLPKMWSWYDCTVELPTEVMMYGSTIWGQSRLWDGTNYHPGGLNIGINQPILALAAVAPYYITARTSLTAIENYWLRDVASASCFCNVSADGIANAHVASSAGSGLRPYFALHG